MNDKEPASGINSECPICL